MAMDEATGYGQRHPASRSDTVASPAIWSVAAMAPAARPSIAAGDPATVAAIIRRLGADPLDMVTCPDGARRPLAEALGDICDIDRPAALALEVLASRAPGFGKSRRLQALAEGYPGAEPADAGLLDLLQAFPSARPPVQELIAALALRASRAGGPAAAALNPCKNERRPMPIGFARRVDK